MSAGDRESPFDDIALYALGVLPAREASAAALLIASDASARAEYSALRTAVDAVGLIAEEPVDSARSARMKERLMARVRADAADARSSAAVARGELPARARRAPAWFPAWVWGSGLVAAAAVAFTVITVAQDVNLRGDLAQTQRHASALQVQLAQSERASQQDRRVLTDLFTPGARRYDVAQGAVVVRHDRIYLALSRLPALPKGRVYQAWTAVSKGAKTMQPSVTFTPNADGVAVVALPVDAAHVGLVAMTVEPDGGSKVPSTKPTFIRPLS